MRLPLIIGLCLFAWLPTFSAVAAAGDDSGAAWTVGPVVFEAGPEGRFDDVAAKDPSVVFFEGRWHLFYTARKKDKAVVATGYVSAADLSGLRNAPRHELKMLQGANRYVCAPQVFYFTPQRRWYLIFQTSESNYQPVFSTTTTIANPESWSEPLPLLKKDDRAKWIDFWVICDDENAYFFHTREHKDVFVRTTRLADFPGGWGKGRKVFTGVHEAVHVYKTKGRHEYHMVYELKANDGERSFGLATAPALAGPWTKATDAYAVGDQLWFAPGRPRWTDMVSHGEAIRVGFDQRLEYDPAACQWLIQGLPKKELGKPYPMLPWKLGVIGKVPDTGRVEHGQ